MFYYNQKYDLKVQAPTREEAIARMASMLRSKLKATKVDAMAFTRKELEKEIKDQTTNIVSLWCLCWYLSNVENKNGLLNHEKGKLKGFLIDLNDIEYKGSSTSKVKRKIIEHEWLEKRDFNKKLTPIIARMSPKFEVENIEDKDYLYDRVAKEFQKELKELIDIICDGNKDSVTRYINKFKVKEN